MTVFNTASISPVQLLGEDGQNPAGAPNPLAVALGSGSITAIISGSLSFGAGTTSIGTASVQFIPRAAALSSGVISFSALGTSTIVTGSGTAVINVYRLLATLSTATLLTFRSGTTLLTGDMSVGANGSIVLDYATEPWFTCGSGASLNMSVSATSQVSGRIYYTQG